jgi:hypothetical protein
LRDSQPRSISTTQNKINLLEQRDLVVHGLSVQNGISDIATRTHHMSNQLEIFRQPEKAKGYAMFISRRILVHRSSDKMSKHSIQQGCHDERNEDIVEKL